MIYNYVSIQEVYTRLRLVLNFVDDRELANIYEFCGYALRELRIAPGMKPWEEEVEITDYRAPLPCDLFSLIQICYNGFPLTYSGRTFNYLVCKDCTTTNDAITSGTYIRKARTLTGIIADFNSDGGVEAVGINQVVKVSNTHISGGTVGHYYRRRNAGLPAIDLSLVDYTTTDWLDVSTSVSNADEGLTIIDSNPYSNTYNISPGYINTNIYEGTVNVIYNAIPTDGDGFYMFPDDENLLWALEYYCKIRLIQRGYKFPEEDLKTCKAEWMRHRDMARSNVTWPTIDEMDAFAKRWTRPLQVLDRNQNFYKHEM